MNNFITMKHTITVVFMVSFLFASCSKEQKDIHIEERLNNKIDYILNDTLTSKDYSEFDGYRPKDGLIPTAEIAIKIAEPVLKHIYGNEQIEKQKPFSINLDNNIWVIEGHWDGDGDGGNVYIEISKKNGEILKVVHGK